LKGDYSIICMKLGKRPMLRSDQSCNIKRPLMSETFTQLVDVINFPRLIRVGNGEKTAFLKTALPKIRQLSTSRENVSKIKP
jgi:hypothetical protein